MHVGIVISNAFNLNKHFFYSSFLFFPIHVRNCNILFHLFISAWRLQLCIAIGNGSNNTIGASYYSAHQAACTFSEHHVDMASCVHRKCQTRAGVSGDVNKTFECVTITDRKFSNKVLI